MLSWILHIPILFILIHLIWRKAQDKALKNYFFPALSFKILSGLMVGILYFYYYGGGDTVTTYKDAITLNNILLNDLQSYWSIIWTNQIPEHYQQDFLYSGQPRAIFFLKIISPLVLFSLNNYWISSIYLSIFSFLGFWTLSNTTVSMFGLERKAVSLAFLFFPGIVFWTSGIIKEALIMGLLTFLIHFFIIIAHLEKKVKVLNLVAVLIIIYLSLKVKFYFIAVLLPLLLAYYLTIKITGSETITFKKAMMFSGFFAFCIFLASFSNSYLDLHSFAESLYNNYEATLLASSGKNIIVFENFEPSVKGIIKTIPSAVFAGLFRPFFTDVDFGIPYLVVLENLFILFLLSGKIYGVYRSSNFKNTSLLLLPLLIYVIMEAGLITMASPNWGTLHRYRAGYMPFFILFVCINNPLLNKLFKKKPSADMLKVEIH